MTALRQIGPAENLEWQLRCDLAAAFRVHARLGMNEQIGNHHSLMLPGVDTQFLINPRGLLFQEITASKLIVCDLEGKVVRGFRGLDVGDRVNVEMTPYDLTKGRITYRFK